MTSYATPGFSWALPEQPPTDPTPVKQSKPLANPLLVNNKTTLAPSPKNPSTSSFRFPFSPVENNSMRQRRKPVSNGMPVAPIMNGTSTKPIPPPKASYLLGDAPISNDVIPKLTNGDSNGNNSGQLALRESEAVPQLTNGEDHSFERWVLVYGYATQAQYEAVMRRFKSLGNVVSSRGTCRPGVSNWVAIQYESVLHAEKALCQQHCLLLDGIVVGVTRMNADWMSSLDKNVTTSSVPKGEGYLSNRLEDRFREATSNNRGPQEEDILLLDDDVSQKHGTVVGRYRICEMVMAWIFGW